MGGDGINDSKPQNGHENEPKSMGPPFNLQQWTFGSMLGPNEITDHLPKISLVPEEFESLMSLNEPDFNFLEQQDQNPMALKTLANWIHRADVTYIKLKEPEYTVNPSSTNHEYFPIPEPALASKIKYTTKLMYPQVLSIDFEGPSIPRLNPEDLFSELLEPFTQVEVDIQSPAPQPITTHISKHQDVAFDGNLAGSYDLQSLDPKQQYNVKLSETSETPEIYYSDLSTGTLDKPKVEQKPVVKTAQELLDIQINKLGGFLFSLKQFRDQMKPENEYTMDDMLVFEGESSIITPDMLAKAQKLITKVAKQDALDKIDSELLSMTVQLLHNNVKCSEYKTIFDQNSIFSVPSSEDDISSRLQSTFQIIKSGLLAAKLALTMATSLESNGHLYGENLMLSSLNLIRNHLSFTLFPAIEVFSIGFNMSKQANLSQDFVTALTQCVSKLSEISSLISSFIQDFFLFMKKSELASNVIITLSYICISTLFVDLNGSSKKTIFSKGSSTNFKKQFQIVLNEIFTNYPDQRPWILEEVLISLIKLSTDKKANNSLRLDDGRSVHFSSALLLQLSQSCCAQVISKNVASSEEYLDFSVDNFSPKSKAFEPIIKKLLFSSTAGYEETTKAVTIIIKFMISRLTKGKSSELEHKILFDNTIEDVLILLNLPDWPAAEIFLRVLSTVLMNAIDDNGTEPYLRNLAIDYLGQIASRLKKNSLETLELGYERVRQEMDHGAIEKGLISSLINFPEEINLNTSSLSVQMFWKGQESLVTFLHALAAEEQSAEGAKLLRLCELAISFGKVYFQPDNTSMSDEPHKVNELLSSELAEVIKSILSKVVVLSCRPMPFDSLKSSELLSVSNRELSFILSESLSFRKPLSQSFDLMLSRILFSLEMSTYSFRSKAIKALCQIVVNYPEIISLPKVRSSVVLRLQDNSSSVRDSAVDLIGRYISMKPEISQNYYKAISDRVLDTGTSVRKRVVKLLREMFHKTDDQSIKIDICCKLLGRVCDNEHHVRDLATKSLTELWFCPIKNFSIPTDCESYLEDDQKTEFDHLPTLARKEVIERVMIISDVIEGAVALSVNDQLVLDFISKSLEKPKEARSEFIKKWCFNMIISKILIGGLFSRLVELGTLEDKSKVCSLLRTIFVFCASKPSLMPSKHLSTLEPYLKAAFDPIQQMNMYYSLKIYNQTLPSLKYQNTRLLSAIEISLIASLPKVSPTVLNETVPCICLVADILGTSNQRILKVYQSCFERLKVERANFDQHKKLSAEKNTIRVLLISGLICQYIDKIKEKRAGISQDSPSQTLNNDTMLDELYDMFRYFEKAEMNMPVRIAALQSIGFMVLSYPKFLISETCHEIFASVFAADSSEIKLKLLELFTDYLKLESLKKPSTDEDSEETTMVALNELVGDAEVMGEANISSAIMQRFLDSIIGLLLGKSVDLQIKALELIGLILEQGHVHPIKCMPALITMMTIEDGQIRKISNDIYAKLSNKFPSFIHARNSEALTVLYDYHKQLDDGKLPHGFRSAENQKQVSVLDDFYTHLRNNRQKRNELFQTSIKYFDYDLKNRSSIDLGYLKFLAESFATLEFKTLEEVIYLFTLINQVISITGANVLYHIDTPNDHNDASIAKNRLLDGSIAMILLLTLKLTIQSQYGLTHSKLLSSKLDNSKVFKDRLLSIQPNFDPSLNWLKLDISKLSQSDTCSNTYEKFKSLLAQDTTVLSEDRDEELDFNLPQYKIRATRNLRTRKQTLGKPTLPKTSSTGTTGTAGTFTDDNDDSGFSNEESDDDPFVPNLPIKGLR